MTSPHSMGTTTGGDTRCGAMIVSGPNLGGEATSSAEHGENLSVVQNKEPEGWSPLANDSVALLIAKLITDPGNSWN